MDFEPGAAALQDIARDVGVEVDDLADLIVRAEADSASEITAPSAAR